MDHLIAIAIFLERGAETAGAFFGVAAAGAIAVIGGVSVLRRLGAR